ncbi:SH3 domain-containing protein [Calothrix sp. 336/3]|uniref:SH3 domain-containing protein n=1 Tax=Calothrix sp. 336/3 TaxID=1337936 RepID=UPI0006245EF9|nr:SH3 domain-containing protein [Calothrix sp. 336/3]AKG24482.1 hypothetical protein IJ00_06005 [Calothrix sp. 336/3]
MGREIFLTITHYPLPIDFTMLNILKYILGIILAIAIMAGSSVAVALFLMNRTSIPPAKPVFSNDTPALRGVSATSKNTTKKSPETKPPATTQTPTPTPEATETPAEELPAGAYRARVTWQKGLVLRQEPLQEAEKLGGIAYKQKVVVLQESDDKAWQKIRITGSNQEGWVKAGNLKQVSDDDTENDDTSEENTEQQ